MHCTYRIRKKLLLVSLFVAICLSPLQAFNQGVNTVDSLAVVDLYNATNGPNWINKTNWLTPAPLGTWYGITVRNGRVTSIGLSSQRLKGELPTSIGNLSALTSLYLPRNELSGLLPESIGNLTEIQSIELSQNLLSGILPSSLNSFKPGVFIVLSQNRFTFSSTRDLSDQGAYYTFSDQAPIPLIKVGNVLSVSAGGVLRNNVYTWYRDNEMIQSKAGDSTLTITEPGKYSVSVRTYPQWFQLHSIVPTSTEDSLLLVDFYKSTNGDQWIINTGWLTSAPASTWFGITAGRAGDIHLNLGGNNLTGSIPSSIGNLTNLHSFSIGGNKVSGSIPASIGNLSNLASLGLANNQFTGNIPTSIGQLTELTALNLEQNQLTGSIPSSIGNLSKLYTLSFARNQLTGSIPSTIGNLINLEYFFLFQNQLSGSIPNSIGNLPKLFDFNASDNQLTGPLPGSIGKMTKLTVLTLSNNQLTGPLPDSLRYAHRLSRLQLNNNLINGNLPEGIGLMPSLGDVYLQKNRLSGAIPSSLSINGLAQLYIQENNYTFTALDPLPKVHFNFFYSPQASIPLIRKGNELSVSAGGVLSNNTYYLYKDHVLLATQTGDSLFVISATGNYHIEVKNSVATLLTLSSDTVDLQITLAEKTSTVVTNVTGSVPIDVLDGTVKLISLTPAGSPPLSGNVTSTVTLDPEVKTFNNRPYLQRHYDINPVNNPASAEATITLYFTQQEFDAFNAYITANNPTLPLLPVNGIDNGNVRVIQFHGQFTGSSDPENYTNGSQTIIPQVAWDKDNKWWAVTFPVKGFSGFFLSTANIALPLRLLEFKGVGKNNITELIWVTSNEINTKQFIIERSEEGINFSSIGEVSAKSSPEKHVYTFTDSRPLPNLNYYRLKMIDIDGKFTYSAIVVVNTRSVVSVTVHPNPARDVTFVLFSSTVPSNYTIHVADLSGRIIKRINGRSVAGKNKIAVSLQELKAGTYMVLFRDDVQTTVSIKLIKK